MSVRRLSCGKRGIHGAILSDDEGKRRLLMTIYDDLKAIDQRFNPVVTLDHAM